MAIQHKDNNKIIADTFNELSKQEYNHIQILYTQLKKMIASLGEPIDMMKELINWQQTKIIDKSSCVQTTIDMYK